MFCQHTNIPNTRKGSSIRRQNFKGAYWISSNSSFIQYCDSNISLTPLRATTIAIAIVGRAITIWEAIQKRSHEPIYKTNTKIETEIKSDNFAIANLEER